MNIPKKWDKGRDVQSLQDRLILLGYSLPNFGPDGDFGDETDRAVRSWQLDYHVDGTLDANEMQAPFPDIPHGQREVVEMYGKPWDDVDGWMQQWIGPVELPQELRNLAKRGTIWTNRDLVPVYESVFDEIVDQGLARHLKTYHGCFNCRKIRGSKTQWSTHTWSLSIDLNAAENMMGTEPKMNMGVVEIFDKHGFTWGGRFRRKDGMHFQRVKGF